MKIGNRRRGIYSEEKRAQQRPSERGSEGGNWRGRRKRARESERESVGEEGGFFLLRWVGGGNREATCVLATRLRRHVMLGLFRTWPLH
jgi:hypothetical protein